MEAPSDRTPVGYRSATRLVTAMSPAPGPEQGTVTGLAGAVRPGLVPTPPPPSTPSSTEAPSAWPSSTPTSGSSSSARAWPPWTATIRRRSGRPVDEVLQPPYGDLVADHLRRTLDSGIPMLDVETWGTFADPHAPRSFTSSFYRLDSSSGPSPRRGRPHHRDDRAPLRRVGGPLGGPAARAAPAGDRRPLGNGSVADVTHGPRSARPGPSAPRRP